MKAIQSTQVRKHFQEVIDRVHYTGEPVIITKRNKPWVIIKPLPEERRKESDFYIEEEKFLK